MMSGNAKMFYSGRFGELAKRSGIYRITIKRGDLPPRHYVGQGVCISKRWSSHLRLLRRGDHWNADFQADFAKYGIDALSFEIVVICEKRAETLALYEQLAVDAHNPDFLYNLWKKCVITGAGTPASPQRKIKVAAKLKGIKRSDETKAAVGRAQVWKRTPEGRLKLSAGQKNSSRPSMSAEERAHRSETTHFRHLSPESHRKSRAGQILRWWTLNKGSAWVLHG
jgi:group I intron endonuclease